MEDANEAWDQSWQLLQAAGWRPGLTYPISISHIHCRPGMLGFPLSRIGNKNIPEVCRCACPPKAISLPRAGILTAV